jgi:DNA polymerase-3 subunit delta
MKIAPKSVDSFLLSPSREHLATLIYGADGGLVRERAEKIAKAILGESFSDPFAKLELSEAELLADPARLCDELSSVSMMNPKRVIIVRDAGNNLTRVLEPALSYFHKDNYLIIIADELTGKSSLRLLFEKEQSCAALACYKDEMRDVSAVIRKKFEESGIAYDREVMDYLASQLGNDRYVTYQELEKLALYAGDEKRISLEDAKQLVDYNQTAQLDDIINAVADRNLSALEKTVTQHLREGTQPIAYLRALQRYFNRLYAIRAQMDSGQSAESVISSLRPPVFFKQQPILTRHANSWNTENIVKALRFLITAELSCKTSDFPAIAASSRELLKVTQLR